jgi:hypothetical protein
MTIAPTHRMASSNGTPPPAGPAPQPGGGFNTVDPVRLLRKYRAWLVIVLILGAIVGAGSHFLLKEVAPSYRAQALFRVYPPRTDVTEKLEMGNEEELAIFMATEAQIMTSPEVLRRAMENPSLSRLAPNWAAQFTRGGRYSPVDAAIELEKRVSSRVVAGTAFIRLSMSYQEPDEVAALVGFVRMAYLADLERRGRALTANETSALDLSIVDSEDEIKQLQARRDQLAKDYQLDALDVRVSSVRADYELRSATVVTVRQTMIDYGTRLQ